MNVYQHLGDLGDVIAALPVMRHLGPGQLILGNIDGKGTDREQMDEERFNALAPLIERQPYIFGVSHEHDAKGVTHSFYNFRQTPCRIGEAHTLVNWQSDFFGLPDVDVSPWLSGILPAEETRGKAVFSRTLRYHGTNFDWRGIVDEFPNAIFLGFDDERRAFCELVGKEIPWRPTANLLEAAELIAGSEILVSNQCVMSWIAMGMGHRLIQEVCHWSVNSIIRRDNAEFRY